MTLSKDIMALADTMTCSSPVPYAKARAALERRAAVAEELLEALKKARQAMMVEHGLVPDYGWGEFVSMHIDPAIAHAHPTDKERA